MIYNNFNPNPNSNALSNISTLFRHLSFFLTFSIWVSTVLFATAPYAVCEKYDCLAFTLEMPFLDNINRPDEKYGWSHLRSIQLGKALLDPLLAIIDDL